METLYCLGRHVAVNCSAEDIQVLKDKGIYGYVSQYFYTLSFACYEYIDGNIHCVQEKNTRAAVGMEIPLGFPRGMSMGWVWGLR